METRLILHLIMHKHRPAGLADDRIQNLDDSIPISPLRTFGYPDIPNLWPAAEMLV